MRIVLSGAMFSVVLSVLVGCAPSTGSRPEPVVFQCGKAEIQAQLLAGNAEVKQGDDIRQLRRVKAASGSKYQDQTGENMIWLKRSDALVRWQGQQLPTCTRQGTLPEKLALRGNEPFWLATLNGNALDLTTPNSERQYRVTEKQVNGEQNNAWQVTTDGDLSFAIERQICRDSMSGKAYPYTVSMTRSGNVQPGCGGETDDLLRGVTWQAKQSLQSVPVAAKAATLQFLANGKLAGFDGCNRFFGNYSVAGETPRLQVVGATKMMCPPTAMKYSAGVTSLLNNTVKIDITETQITITAASGQQLVLVPSQH